MVVSRVLSVRNGTVQEITAAGPASPVVITGLTWVPVAG